MIIYNITISVEKEIVQEWLDWMQKKHIPQVMSTGCFLKAQINKVLALDDSEETYAIAYTCIDKKNFEIIASTFHKGAQDHASNPAESANRQSKCHVNSPGFRCLPACALAGGLCLGKAGPRLFCHRISGNSEMFI